MHLLLPALLAYAAPGEFTPVLAQPSAETRKLSRTSGGDFPKLLDKISASLLHRPYQLGPLGEGSGEDPDPLYRLDAFDCTTFLETVMANAFCTEAGTAKSACLRAKMHAIRYAGEATTFATRNHVPELDWLPNAERKGFVRDLRASFYPEAKEWKQAAPAMDRAAWLATKMKNPPPAAKQEAPPLHYLPVSFFFEPTKMEDAQLAELKAALAARKKELEEKRKAPGASEEDKRELELESFRADLEFLRKTQSPVEERLRAIPSGTVLNLVHAPWKDPAAAKISPMITHQGLILQLADGTFLRHAAPNNKHVSSQRLDDYLRRFVRSANFRGISLYQLLPPAR